MYDSMAFGKDMAFLIDTLADEEKDVAGFREVESAWGKICGSDWDDGIDSTWSNSQLRRVLPFDDMDWVGEKRNVDFDPEDAPGGWVL
jgi:hypothetical protein